MNQSDLQILIKAFPQSLKEDIIKVSKHISNLSYLENENNNNISGITAFSLLSDEIIEIPNRVYYKDCNDITNFTNTQKLIYHCIFSRSCDGFVRENNLQQILNLEYEDWCFPYIVKLADEYVIEILDKIYIHFKNQDCTKLIEFCSLNEKYLNSANSRMISYWNEYYRNQYIKISDYIGKKLFVECFGIDK